MIGLQDNYDPITDSDGNRIFENPAKNLGRWDAVNIYGDQTILNM